MKLRHIVRAGLVAAGLLTGQILMTDAAFAETVQTAVQGAPHYQGECLAAYRMANQIKRGGTFYEDFSYPHASKVVSQYNDTLADQYWAQPGAQFDKAAIRAWFLKHLEGCTKTTDTSVMA